jgi:hypothetical protein
VSRTEVHNEIALEGGGACRSKELRRRGIEDQKEWEKSLYQKDCRAHKGLLSFWLTDLYKCTAQTYRVSRKPQKCKKKLRAWVRVDPDSIP